MTNELINAVVVESGKNVQVYKQISTGKYVDYEDCKTIYKKHELSFIK